MTLKINTSTPVFFINLDDNTERKENIEKQLNNLQFENIHRVSAIDTRSDNDIIKYTDIIKPESYQTLLDNIKTGTRKKHRELTRGAIGCYLSHLKIYNMIIEQNIPYAIICEDDCNIIGDYSDFWDKISTINIPNDTDILLFDALIHEYDSNNCPTINICQVYFFFGLHFYLVTLKGAKELVKHLLPIEYQIDTQISILAYQNRIHVYGYTDRRFAGQDATFKTNIQNLKCPTCDALKEKEEIKNIINSGVKSYDIDTVKSNVISKDPIRIDFFTNNTNKNNSTAYIYDLFYILAILVIIMLLLLVIKYGQF